MNKYEIEGDVVLIHVSSKTKGDQTVLVDVEDWNSALLDIYRIGLKDDYPIVYKGGHRVKLHHLVLPPRAGYVVDHLNLNKLDSRRSNLRHCRQKDSNINKGIPVTNRSGVVGVFWDNFYGKWVGQLKFDGKQHRHYFENFEGAVEYRKGLEKQLWGTFVRGAH